MSFDGSKYSFAFLSSLTTSSSPSRKTSAMGLGFDSIVIPAHHTWLAYLHEAPRYLPDSGFRLALLVFINIPIIVVVLNVLRQLVRLKISSPILDADVPQVIPRHPSLPPEVFHLIPYFGSTASYGNDPIAFLDSCRKKVRMALCQQTQNR